jgi:hypothetical protein
MYSDTEDADRISDDLSVKDLEKLVRRFTSLSKNHEVPSSCRVEPFSGAHTLPEVSIFLQIVFTTFDHLSVLSCLDVYIFLIVLFSAETLNSFMSPSSA